MKNKFKFLMGIKIVVGIIFFFVLFGYGTMLLWNWLVPVLFKGPTIVFWQAIGLLALSKILFGGYGGRWGRRGCCGTRRSHWKYKMEERLKNMSPEERANFKNSCGGWYWTKEENVTNEQK